MKKLLPVLLILGVFTLGISCKKKDKPTKVEEPTFEERLEGTWNLKAVKYDSEIPSLTGGDPVPVNGEGTEVGGSIKLTRNPHKFEYDFSFNASIDPGLGSPVTVPIQQAGTGTWTTTSDNSKIITTADSGEEVIFNVKINEANRQVYETTVTQDIQGFFSIEADLELEFQR